MESNENLTSENLTPENVASSPADTASLGNSGDLPAPTTQPELSPMDKQMEAQRDAIPADIRENLKDGSDQVYLAAYTSALENGMSEEAAKRVAWNTIEHDFVKSADGKWQRRPDEPGIHNKQVTSGGN